MSTTSKNHLPVVLGIAASLAIAGNVLATVSFEWVPVGNPGNAPDTKVMTKGGAPDFTTGYGSVGYLYNIAKYSVTNSQYVEFLNAADPAGTNTRKLYDTRMSTNPLGLAYTGGVDFNVAAPSGSKYSVKPGQSNRPATWINWFSSARFVNWLSNGQGSANTENGVYNLTLTVPVRTPGATIFIPSEDEYYKAAYYDPTKNGTGGYWEYASQSDATPTSEAPVGGTNSMNIRRADGTYWQTNAPFSASTDYLIDNGAYTNTQSYYGASNMDDNLYGWTESFRTGFGGNLFPVYRGGAWYYDSNSNGASHRNIYSFATSASYAWFGLRLASLPVLAESVWNADGNGNWSTPSNWAGGVPGGVGTTARFGSVITSPRTVTLDGPQTVGTLIFDHSIPYTITGSSTLSLDVAAGSADITVLSGQHVIAAPVVLLDNTTITVASGGKVTSSDSLSGASVSILKTGPGQLAVRNVVANSLDVQQGEVSILAASGGSIRVTHLQIAPASVVNLNGTGEVVIDYTGSSPIDAIRTMTLDGRLSNGDVNAAIGFGEVSQLPPGTVAGADATTILIRSTILGDTTLDRSVSFDDLLRLAQNYGTTTGATWTDGDFNSDRAVDFDDLLGLAQNYGSSLQLALPEGVSGQFGSDWALALSLVPEPSGVALLSLVALTGRCRKRSSVYQPIAYQPVCHPSVAGPLNLSEGEMQ